MNAARGEDDRAARIEAVLRARLDPVGHLRISDDSARHAGHAGAREGGQTHYTVEVVSPVFEGLGRVARSRLVHEALAAEFAGGLHALALALRTPREVQPG
ncbi:BolA protein [Endobacter medicaginis]|uniref:BolA protein n=1 Tax=Endobacter medicaginis TaxID=1181271 RepID=A0A839V193_9PROT|nr:BolA family protein [Endobacter medicaginis]MBB3174453.1 BolA protein [Endobacter medicaginis]MCX5475098.1 BolA family transcriptional regulator [Endobacter medicaginis]